MLDGALRDDLEGQAPRAMAVIDPVKLELTNWADVFGAGHLEPCSAPAHPQRPELGQRRLRPGPEVWIERDDFAEVPAKGFFRLFPGNKVRLKYGMVVECTGCKKDADGHVTAVLATRACPTPRAARRAPTRSRSRARSPGSACTTALPPSCACTTACSPKTQPDAGGRDFREALNPASKRVVQGYRRALAGRGAGR